MKTDLPAGTYFRFRYKGHWDYGRIEPNGTSYMLLDESQTVGQHVVTCVWRGDVLAKEVSK